MRRRAAAQALCAIYPLGGSGSGIVVPVIAIRAVCILNRSSSTVEPNAEIGIGRGREQVLVAAPKHRPGSDDGLVRARSTRHILIGVLKNDPAKSVELIGLIDRLIARGSLHGIRPMPALVGPGGYGIAIGSGRTRTGQDSGWIGCGEPKLKIRIPQTGRIIMLGHHRL